jgi:ABC-type nitrate/sulfonate/bicarbonate transport system substrate-binding protein
VWLGWLVGVTAVTLAIASAVAGYAGAAKPKESTVPLNVAVGSTTTSYGAFWVAEAKGLFAKHHVNVNVTSYNASTTTSVLVESGQVTLALFTAPLGMEIASAGKPTWFVYELSNYQAGAQAVITQKSITSMRQLKALNPCRLATVGAGTLLYGFGHSVIKGFGLSNCQIVPEGTVPEEVSAVASGSVQAAVVPYASAASAVASGAVHLTLNPLKESARLAKTLVPHVYPAFVVFGLRSAISAHKVAVQRFVAALRQANALLLRTPVATLGTMTAGLPAFSGSPASVLAQAWRGTLSQIPSGPSAGFINKKMWRAALNGFASWGIPGYSPHNPAYAYRSIVNMNFILKRK